MDKENKKEQEVKKGMSFGGLITFFAIVSIVVVGIGIYQAVSGPYRTADQLREYLDTKNCTEDYQQGWLDCVDHYLLISIGPSNSTSNILNDTKADT